MSIGRIQLTSAFTARSNANAKITEQTVEAEMLAYAGLNDALNLQSSDSLNYIWWDTLHSLAASGAGKEFLVGVNPQVVLPVEQKA